MTARGERRDGGRVPSAPASPGDTGTARFCPQQRPLSWTLSPPCVCGCSGECGGTGLFVGGSFCPAGEFSLAVGSLLSQGPASSWSFASPFFYIPTFLNVLFSPAAPCGDEHNQGWVVTALSPQCWGDTRGSHRACLWGLALGEPGNKRGNHNVQQSCDCAGQQGGSCGCHSSEGAAGSPLSHRHWGSPAS